MSDDPQAEKFRRDCTDAVNNHAQILREQGEMINRLQSELVFLKSLIAAAQARGIELTHSDFFQIPTPQPRRRKP